MSSRPSFVATSPLQGPQMVATSILEVMTAKSTSGTSMARSLASPSTYLQRPEILALSRIRGMRIVMTTMDREAYGGRLSEMRAGILTHQSLLLPVGTDGIMVWGHVLCILGVTGPQRMKYD